MGDIGRQTSSQFIFYHQIDCIYNGCTQGDRGRGGIKQDPPIFFPKKLVNVNAIKLKPIVPLPLQKVQKPPQPVCI